MDSSPAFWFGLIGAIAALLKGVQIIVRNEITPLDVRVTNLKERVDRHENLLDKAREAT